MGSQTRWLGAVGVVAALAIGLIVWTVVQKKGLPPPSDAMLDSLVMGVVEKSMLQQVRREVSRHCVQFLPRPVAVDSLVQCETTEQGVKLSRLEVLRGPDGGVVADDFKTCILEAVAGLEIGATHVPDPRLDGGVKLRLPTGRVYELDVALELAHVDEGGYGL